MDQLLSLWDDILQQVKENFDITDVSFKSFVKPLEPYGIDGNDLLIIFNGENDTIGINYIKKKYETALKVTIAEMTGIEYNLVFLIEKNATNYSVKKEQKQNTIQNPDSYKKTNLIPKLTFENFVTGSSNQFAYTAALAVAESPGEAYNPLYIYGGPGLGKTHLMHSIGNYIINQDPSKNILYVTSEQFVNEVIDSIRRSNNSDSMPKLREKYRSVDVLMIDDIQFMLGKDSTQSEFFYTFNTLFDAQKQIIISSDRPPKEMEILEERIKSRFEMGLMTDVGIPDYETRMAILLKKMENEHINIKEEVLIYIAENVKSNVRELEGALIKIKALTTLDKNNREVTLEQAIDELSTLIYPNKEKEITPQMIIEMVSSHYNISIDQMCSSKRTREISEPRQIAMYLCKEMTEYPFQSIGSLLGGKDHSTVIHGVKKIGDRYNDDESFHKEIEDIKKKINNQ